jgi:ribose-phosphate pyrophosphokinase
MGSTRDLCVVATSSAAPLAEKVAAAVGSVCHRLRTERFENENLSCRAVGIEAEGRDVAFFQAFPSPVSDHVLELLFGLRALAAMAPRRLTAVLPYLAYSRSDRAEAPGEAIPARLLAELIECAGAQRVVACDLHSPQLAGFFSVPVVELSARGSFASALRAWQLAEPVIVSPDLGGAKRATRLAEQLGWPFALVRKERRPGGVTALGISGEVRGRSAVLLDDEIATGATLVAAAELLLAQGARCVRAVATHGVFAGDALERLERSPIERILVADSLPLRRPSPRIEGVSLASELAAALGGPSARGPLAPAERRS